LDFYPGLDDCVAQIEVLEHGDKVYTDILEVPFTSDQAPYKIALEKSIAIKAGDVYTLSVSRPNSDIIGYYAKTCHRTCGKDSVYFTFSRYSQMPTKNPSRTTEYYGQIPCLYFKKV